MAKQIYIDIDSYYDVEEYNRIINALKNNNVEYNEWILTLPPYSWIISINETDRPKFVDYEELPKNKTRFLVSRVNPLRSEQVFKLTRRETDSPKNFERFTSNDTWRDIGKAKHLIFFKFANSEELENITKELKTKIYYIGRYKRWKICVGFNPYIASKIAKDRILYEKNEKELSQFKKVSDIETDFNYRVLVTAKITDKYSETLSWKNGKKIIVDVPNKSTSIN